MLSIIAFSALNLLMLWGLERKLFLRQLLFWIVGLFLLFLIKKLNIKKFFTNNHKWIYLFCLILLGLPLILGKVTRGSNRWITLIGFNFQPSEFVKPFLVGVVAFQMTKRIENLLDLILALAIALPPTILILIQPDLGSAGIIFLVLCGLIFAAKPKPRWWLWLTLVALIALIIGGKGLIKPYQVDRINSFLNPYSDPLGKGYNTIQAQLAIGAGGWLGRGFGSGRQTQLEFLPEKHTDFIFAAIGEELGFLGIFFTLLFYFYFFSSMIKKIGQTKDIFKYFMRIGIFLIFFLQTTISIAMNLNLFPVVGLPLPFVSYGGSSLLTAMISLAFFL